MKKSHMFAIFCVSFIISALIYKRSLKPIAFADISSSFALSVSEKGGAFAYDKNDIAIKKNDVVQVVPTNAINTGATYSSSNPNVATVDANGNIYGCSNGKATITAKNTDGKVAKLNVTVTSFIITIDPGHGGKDSGASRKKTHEKDIVLDIAKCCQNELEKYSGITVNLTRNNDTFIPLEERAIIAQNQNANLFVSMHINASGDHTKKGALVIVSHSKYKKVYNERSSLLGNIILNQLRNCGLRKKEIMTRTLNGIHYSFDNSPMDYYAVIRHSIERDIPGIIVEHGFIDSSDFSHLNTYNKHCKIGINDGVAIAKFLSLKKARAKTLLPVLASKLKLYTYRKTLRPNRRYNLSTMVYPRLTSNKKLKYVSSEPRVASVNENGQIKTLNKGKAIITVSTTDGSRLKKRCKIIVK